MNKSLIFIISLFAYVYCEIQKSHAELDTVYQGNRVRRQLFGGISKLPGRGFNQQFGARGTIIPAQNHQLSGWGSLSQDRGKVFSSPITYSAGADWKAPRGGLSIGGSHTPGLGSLLNVGGSASIVKTPQHSLDAFATHTRTFDTNFHQLGRGSTTGGLQYSHQNGGSLSLSGTHTPGMPNSGSVSGSLPLFKNKNTNLDLTGGVDFGGGRKPTPQVGVSLSTSFK